MKVHIHAKRKRMIFMQFQQFSFCFQSIAVFACVKRQCYANKKKTTVCQTKLSTNVSFFSLFVQKKYTEDTIIADVMVVFPKILT